MHDPVDPMKVWCTEVLQGTEIADIQGHALFRSIVTPDTAQRLGLKLRQHPKEYREILVPFRTYGVPRTSRNTFCGTCDEAQARSDANMVAESVRCRLATKYGADSYVVRVDNTAGHGPKTLIARLREYLGRRGSLKVMYGTFVIVIEEAG